MQHSPAEFRSELCGFLVSGSSWTEVQCLTLLSVKGDMRRHQLRCLRVDVRPRAKNGYLRCRDVRLPRKTDSDALFRLGRTIYSILLAFVSDACLSIGSLKYMHHFGLNPFSNPREHWILQASLAHSISDDLSMRSFASVLDASTLAGVDLCVTGFVGGKTGSVATASLIGSSRSKYPLCAHPARARAASKTNSQFIFFCSRHAGRTHILPHHALDAGGKRNGLTSKVADQLISEWSTKYPFWFISDV